MSKTPATAGVLLANVESRANGDTGTAFYEVTWDAGTGGSFIASDSFAGASMTTAVVPEPTSGLLLLLGVAGIALRRRRA